MRKREAAMLRRREASMTVGADIATIVVLLRKADEAATGSDQSGEQGVHVRAPAEDRRDDGLQQPRQLHGAAEHEQRGDDDRSLAGEARERLRGRDDAEQQEHDHAAQHGRGGLDHLAREQDDDPDDDGQRQPGIEGHQTSVPGAGGVRQPTSGCTGRRRAPRRFPWRVRLRRAGCGGSRRRPSC